MVVHAVTQVVCEDGYPSKVRSLHESPLKAIAKCYEMAAAEDAAWPDTYTMVTRVDRQFGLVFELVHRDDKTYPYEMWYVVEMEVHP